VNVKLPTVYDRNKDKPGRKPSYWLVYRVSGVRVREPCPGGGKREAHDFAVQTKRQQEAGTWVHPRDRKTSAHLFETFAREVIRRRVERGVKGADKDERGHVDNHLAAMFPKMPLVEVVRFKVIRNAFELLEKEGKLAGRTIRNIHNTLRAILIEALEDELVPAIPPALTAKRGHLPPPADADPNWRATAVFTPAELPVLLGCTTIPAYRRMIYATLFMAGGRVTVEVLKLKIGDYNRTASPLRSLQHIAAKRGRHKGKEVRIVPVHPDLQRWLDWWVDTGWALYHRRSPTAEDLMFPTISELRLAQGKVDISHNEIYKQWQRWDLPAAGLRHRRIHDARRTLISANRNQAIDQAIVRKLTHRAVADVVLDAYTTIEWQTLCNEVLRVDWKAPPPPEQVHLQSAASAELRELREGAGLTHKDVALEAGVSALDVYRYEAYPNGEKRTEVVAVYDRLRIAAAGHSGVSGLRTGTPDPQENT
jgi:integrase